MFRFALKNLRRRALRSCLSLVGMAVAIVLIIGLVSSSQGIRQLVADSLGQVDGLVVLERKNPDPLLSHLPVSLQGELEALPGVRVVSPEVWFAAASLEGRIAILEGTKALDYTVMVVGLDPRISNRLGRSAIFRENLIRGRYLAEGDRGVALISLEVAEQFEKEPGATIDAGGHEYDVIGIFDTPSMLFNRVLVTDLETVREVSGRRDGFVSVYFIEPEDLDRIDEVERRIEDRFSDLEAQTPEEMGAYASSWIERLDLFLLLITVLPIVGGAVAILNTMLMSFGERMKEFGVMRACGWTRRHLVHLVIFESSILGFLGGLLGVFLGYLATEAVALLLRIKPVTPWWLPVLCVSLSTLLGMAGGTYPAYRAARMNPIHAIRYL